MLFGDRAKYVLLVSGITFATLLMAQGMALFCGLMTWTFTPIRNIRVPIWVADSKVEQVGDNKPLRDIDLYRIRSVAGVDWAAPLFQSVTQARLPDGNSKLVTLTGIDGATLIGAPERMVHGQVEDLRLPNTVILDEYGVERLSEGRARPMGLGDTFEINDREVRIVGICKAHRSFTGGPFVYTTYARAVDYVPQQRKLLTFVLASPQPGISPAELAERIRTATGLMAQTSGEFMWATIWWYVKNTGIPINVGTIVLIGFVIGVAISGQTFYSFVVENTRNLGALKAMGAGTGTLCGMLILQAFSVGILGYGIGFGIVSTLGRTALKLQKVPFYLPWQIPAIVFGAILFICTIAALLGILRVTRLEPAIVFRA